MINIFGENLSQLDLYGFFFIPALLPEERRHYLSDYFSMRVFINKNAIFTDEAYLYALPLQILNSLCASVQNAFQILTTKLLFFSTEKKLTNIWVFLSQSKVGRWLSRDCALGLSGSLRVEGDECTWIVWIWLRARWALDVVIGNEPRWVWWCIDRGIANNNGSRRDLSLMHPWRLFS